MCYKDIQCTKCIHNKVCKKSEYYSKIAKAINDCTSSQDMQNILIEVKCGDYYWGTLNVPGSIKENQPIGTKGKDV